MSAAVALDALDLAALLCSRVCHDLISPTGAIVNGLEVLEEKDSDEETWRRASHGCVEDQI
jgi:histidine phosphotransferase ChpT